MDDSAMSSSQTLGLYDAKTWLKEKLSLTEEKEKEWSSGPRLEVNRGPINAQFRERLIG